SHVLKMEADARCVDTGAGDQDKEDFEVLEGVPESAVGSPQEEQKEKPPPDGGWSAPILSLARRATESLSSTVSHSSALRGAASAAGVLSSKPHPASNDGHTPKPGRDALAVERSNLLNMMKLSVKVLIQSALSLGRSLDSDYPPLQQFFVVLEHCLKHGLRGKSKYMKENERFGTPIKLIEEVRAASVQVPTPARTGAGSSSERTFVGRARAWLCLALMQKKMADYLKALLDHKDLLSEFYEPGALLLEEEGSVIVGMLVGLNVIDANLCLKGEDLDSQATGLFLTGPAQTPSLSPWSPLPVGTLTSRNACSWRTWTGCGKEAGVVPAGTPGRSASRRPRERRRSADPAGVAVRSGLRKVARSERARIPPSGRAAEHCSASQGLEACPNLLVKQLLLGLRFSVAQSGSPPGIVWDKNVTAVIKHLMILYRTEVETVSWSLVSFGRLQEIKGAAGLPRARHAAGSQLCLLGSLACRRLEGNYGMGSHIVSLSWRLERQLCLLSPADCTLSPLSLGLESELKSEKEQRQGLQRELQREKDTSTQLRTQLQQLDGLQKELLEMRREKQQLQKTCEEQEQALQEMGLHLSQSKLKMEDFKEVNKALKGQAWLKDDEATQCKQCQKEFSISRRKHHCRNCGDIYCSSCSSNELALPSYPRPVRVCDTCHTLLLQRCSTGS
uniref:RUN and FYVE domain containing 1 n=1 Tax=Lepisosteus oculatus TaxID=7918 RepID=W5N457_LEPOC